MGEESHQDGPGYPDPPFLFPDHPEQKNQEQKGAEYESQRLQEKGVD